MDLYILSFCSLLAWRVCIVDGIPNTPLFPPLDNWISNSNTEKKTNKKPNLLWFASFYFYKIRGCLQLTEGSTNYIGYCTSLSKNLQFYFRKWNLMSIFFFTFDLKIKLYTRVFDNLVVNEWDSWFEWLNRVTLHSALPL